MAGQAVVSIGDRLWTVSLAATPRELVDGLGGLESIPPGTGMLFDMGRELPIQVTTAPMLFSLDILFLDALLVVNGAARDVAPGYLVTGEVPARYFLEVNARETEGIQKGQQAVLQVLAAQSGPLADQAVSLASWLLTLGLASGLLRSLAQGLLGSGEKAGAGPLLLPQAIVPSKTLGVSGQRGGTVTQDSLDDLQGLLDESKKTESLKKLETALNRLTPEQRRSIDGLGDLEQAIGDYRGITRQGLTPEDYIEEKESAWGEIEEALGNLSLWEEDEGPGPGTEPKTLPATVSLDLPKPAAAGQSVRTAGKKLAASEVEFFADSAGHCCGSLDGSGLRPRMEKAFQAAISRVNGG